MRVLMLCLFAMLASPALGQEWTSYANVRFGYEGAVPPGFTSYGESDNGDGATYASTAQALYYWGSNLLEDSFEAEVAASIGYAERDGAQITRKSIDAEGAVFTGVAREQMFYRRMIPLCDGKSIAAFTLNYWPRDATAMAPIIQRLMKSFRAVGC